MDNASRETRSRPKGVAAGQAESNTKNSMALHVSVPVGASLRAARKTLKPTAESQLFLSLVRSAQWPLELHIGKHLEGPKTVRDIAMGQNPVH